MSRRQPRQLEFVIRSWGGRREGAGRKPAPGRRRVTHRPRPLHDPHRPVLVTMRAQAGIPSLRRDCPFGALASALHRASRATFRVVEFSAQADHLHLLVEAEGHEDFTRGMQGLAIRIAKAVNRALGRHGRMWADRFHARPLSTPREVRNALVYVLQNYKKHLRRGRGLDPRSSAPWFTGWQGTLAQTLLGHSPVARARTWLLRIGWKRHGLLGMDEGPRLAVVRS